MNYGGEFYPLQNDYCSYGKEWTVTQMTDNEIIKALIGKIYLCKEVNAWGTEISLKQLNEILDLINRQQSEIERLKIENQSLRMAANSYKPHYNEAKVEAVREFAGRLKDESFQDEGYYCDIVLVTDIDDVLKEMVGDTE